MELVPSREVGIMNMESKFLAQCLDRIFLKAVFLITAMISSQRFNQK